MAAAQDIGHWLARLGLERYTALFEAQEIDLRDLPHLNDDDLKELGLPLGPRRRILADVAQDAPAAETGRVDSAPAPSTPPGDTGAAAPRSERRQVTVMFCDLVGFTRFSASRDPEEVHRILNRFFAMADSVVERFGGRVDKHIGDAVMAVFGAPIAHHNDPERAVRAALEMHRAAAGLEEGLGLHAGIASGQVLASTTGSDRHREYTVTGDSVNLAARLTDMAEPGATLVSPDVRNALGDLLEAEDLGQQAVDGLAAPVRVWRVGALAPRRGHRGDLVGRLAEQRLFEGLIGNCLEAGQGQVVLLRGEPGIGKSHLADRFEDMARAAGFAVGSAQVLDFGASGAGATLRDLLSGLCPDGDTPADWARALLPQTAGEARDLVLLDDLLGLPADAEGRSLLQAMDEDTRAAERDRLLALLLRARAAEGPLLLRLEDIHWADAGLLRQLASLAELSQSVPVLCLLSTRVEGDPLGPAWRAGAGGARVTTIDLAALSESEAAALAERAEGVAADTRTACIERANGNPLYLQQLLRNADESAREGLPGTLQSILLSRLDRLAVADREIVDAAAVLGQRFDAEALCAVAGLDGFEADALQAAGLIHNVGRRWSFAHALIRDAAYGALVGDKRQALHAAAAAWYRERDPVLHARHLERADDPAAAAALVAAGRHEADGFRYADALELAEGAVARAGAADRFAARALRAEMLEMNGRLAEALAAWEELGDGARGAGERCEALIGRAAALRQLGRGEEALPDLGDAAVLAAEAGLVQAGSRIAGLQGSAAFASGDMDECLRLQQDSLALARQSGDRRLEATALGNLADAEYATGRMVTALARMEACVELAREQGFLRIRTVNCFMLGNLRRYVVGIAPALEILAEAVALADRLMLPRPRVNARMIRGEVLLDRGEFAAAAVLFEAALALAEDMDNDRLRLYLRYELARARLGEDRLGEARTLAAEAMAISRHTGMRFHGPRLLALTALLDAASDSSAANIEEGLAVIGEGVNAHNRLWFRRDAIDWARLRGDWPAMRVHATALAGQVADEPHPWADFFASRGLALADHGEGRGERSALEVCLRKGRAHGLEASLGELDAALAKAA